MPFFAGRLSALCGRLSLLDFKPHDPSGCLLPAPGQFRLGAPEVREACPLVASDQTRGQGGQGGPEGAGGAGGGRGGCSWGAGGREMLRLPQGLN